MKLRTARQPNEQKVAKEAKEGKECFPLRCLRFLRFLILQPLFCAAQLIEDGGEIYRQRGNEFYRLAGRRMCQFDPASVQGLAGENHVRIVGLS